MNPNRPVDHVLCTVKVKITKIDEIFPFQHLFRLSLHTKSLLSNATTTNKAGVSILVGKICHVYCFSWFTVVLVAVLVPTLSLMVKCKFDPVKEDDIRSSHEW